MAALATNTPIAPNPMTPSFLPEISVPAKFFFCFSAIIIAIVSAVISTPLNVIFWGGQTGIAWGDSLFAVMVANHAPVWLASFTDEFVLDILDKVCVAYLAFFIYRQLPKRMVHFFSGDK